MKRYTKADVRFHDDGPCRPAYPAVNVKVHHLPTVDDVMCEFGCTETDAEKAMEFAWQIAQQMFWDSVQHIATECLGDHVEAFAAGRSNGWVVVRNLEDWEKWNAVDLSKWHKFEKAVKQEVAELTSWKEMKRAVAEYLGHS